MTTKDKIALVISIVALIISLLSFVSRSTIQEEVKLYAYDVKYDAEEEFKANFTLALINNGDRDILIPNVWISFGVECDPIHAERIYPVAKVPLLSSKGSIAVGEYEFIGERVGEGNHKICLYSSTVTGISGAKDHTIGSHDLKVIVQRGEIGVVFTDTDEWKNIYPLISKDTFEFR